MTQTSTSFNVHIQTKLLEEKKAHLLLLTYQIREAVAKQQFAIHSKIVEETPQTHNVSAFELSKMFSPEQVIIIDQYWTAYRSYFESHWLNKSGQIKSLFRGHQINLDSEFGQLHHTSVLLVN
ncbi:hypothetical protein [Halalkalibacter lacteus]|uniref:hypothetical protein n=1 Tax=Halalkalibacter lacteus TaxID=3090663 RepID=UPI002FC68784